LPNTAQYNIFKKMPAMQFSFSLLWFSMYYTIRYFKIMAIFFPDKKNCYMPVVDAFPHPRWIRRCADMQVRLTCD